MGDEQPAGIYRTILAKIFADRYEPGMTTVPFALDDIRATAKSLKIAEPRNVPDAVYSASRRDKMPDEINRTAPDGLHWDIRSVGRGLKMFYLVDARKVAPTPDLPVTEMLERRSPLVAAYSLRREQGMLAQVRHSGIINDFTGLHCDSLQSHLVSTVKGIGQVEVDEVYIGENAATGEVFILPVEAKVGKENVSRNQTEQAIALCAKHWPKLPVRALAIQQMASEPGVVVLFELSPNADGEIEVVREQHYRIG